MFVVMQSRPKWGNDKMPRGAFEIAPLGKLTPKCIFLQRGWGQERVTEAQKSAGQIAWHDQLDVT